MKPREAWEAFRDLSPWQRLRLVLKPAVVRWSLVLGILALWTQWPWWMLPVLVYAVSRLVSWVIEKLLWSVRAKLAAFYLNAALVPLLLFTTILLLLGYLVLWNTSARVVEDRLLNLVTWSEQQSRRAESAWWQARSSGRDRRDAAQQVLQVGWSGIPPDRAAAWVRDAETGELLAQRGELAAFEPLRAAWLRERRFAGLTTSGQQHDLELRTTTQVEDAGGRIEIGSAWRIDAALINQGIRSDIQERATRVSKRGERRLRDRPTPTADVHGDLGDPRRDLQWVRARSPQAAEASGILAIYRASQRDSSGSLPAEQSFLDQQRDRIGSSFPVLVGHYLGYPVDWRNGRTRDVGPAILIAFSIEAGIDALLETSYETETVVVWGALTVVVTLFFLLAFATFRGWLYARSISMSVGKLDQGVQAIQGGDFDFRIEPREKDQLGDLAKGFNGMVGQLQELLEQQAAHRVVERELEIARSVQSRLFPQEDPSDAAMEAVGICVPARAVSGDYYDFIPTGAGWDLVVADVSGKGMSAALLMASLQASLRGQYGATQTAPDPAAALDHVNRHLSAYAEPTRFVTLFLARYEGGDSLTYCNAGHNPALLVHQGEPQWLTEGGLMLGPFPDHAYAGHRVAVAPGDLLCLYTDGVTEAMDPQDRLFGEDRLAALLREHAAQPLPELRRFILDAVNDWQQGGSATDDVTFVLLRVRSSDA